MYVSLFVKDYIILLYIPPLSVKPEQQRFTIRSIVLPTLAVGSAAQLGRTLTERTDLVP